MPNNVFYFEYDALFERYAIMTIDGGQNEEVVLKYLKERTSERLFQMLIEWIEKNKREF